jgi:hypothetical protein
LDVVIVPLTAFASLVLDWKGDLRPTGRVGVKLDHIGDPDDPKAVANDPQPSGSAEGRLIGITGLVDSSMIHRARSSVVILDPHLLNPMQETSPLTKEEVVQGRQRRIGLRVGRDKWEGSHERLGFRGSTYR